MNKLEVYFTELFHMEEGELRSGWGEVLPSIFGIIATFVLAYFALFGW